MDDRNVSVYRLFDAEGALLYVGIALSPRDRFAAHQAERPWWPEVARIEIDGGHSREEALRIEADAIRAELPRYNSQHHPAPRPRVERFAYAVRPGPSSRHLEEVEATVADVRATAEEVRVARAELAEAILAAHQAGHSLRVIAHAADVSHQTVKHIVGPKE